MKIFFIIIFLLIPSLALPINCKRCELIQKQIDLELKRNGKYEWGANNTQVGTPADCSSYVARLVSNADSDAITKKIRIAGTPVRRSTTSRMLKNLDGWKGEWIKDFHKVESCDVPLFDFGSSKHTGMWREKTHDNMNMLTHASSRYGIIQQVVRGVYKDYFYTNLMKSLRLD